MGRKSQQLSEKQDAVGGMNTKEGVEQEATPSATDSEPMMPLVNVRFFGETTVLDSSRITQALRLKGTATSTRAHHNELIKSEH